MNIRQMERLAYSLDGPREQGRDADDDQRTLESVGIVNRATARRAGIYTRRMRHRKMAVPK